MNSSAFTIKAFGIYIVLTGMGLLLVAFGIADLLGAAWTFLALRREAART